MTTQQRLGAVRRHLRDIHEAVEALPSTLRQGEAGQTMADGLRMVTAGLARAEVDADEGIYDPLPVPAEAHLRPRRGCLYREEHRPGRPCRFCGVLVPELSEGSSVMGL